MSGNNSTNALDFVLEDDSPSAPNEGGAQVRQLPASRTRGARARANADMLAGQVQAATGMSEEEMAAVRERILNAEIEDLQAQIPEDERSLGALVDSMQGAWEKLGGDFANAVEFDAKEMAVIKDAQDSVGNANLHIREAEKALAEANKKTTWFGRREKAVAEATTRLDAARTARSALDTAIADAEKRAVNMRSKRLQGLSFEGSFARIVANYEWTRNILTQRVEMLQKQYADVGAAKVKFFDEKVETAKAIDTLKGKLAEHSAALEAAQQEMAALTEGTVERVEKEAEVARLTKLLEDTRVKHDQAIIVYHEKEEAANKQALDEAALRSLIHSSKSFLAKILASRESWEVEFRTRVAQIKSLADQAASQSLIQVGAATRIRNAEFSAKAGLASLEAITAMAEAHPQQMRELGNIISSFSEGVQKVDARWKKIDEQRSAPQDAPAAPDESQSAA